MRQFFTLAFSLVVVSVSSAQKDADSYQELIARVRPSVMTIRVAGRDGDELGIGTGFAIEEDLIATNYHVIYEGRVFTVQSPDGEKLAVESVEASDASSDLVLIRVKSDKPLQPLQLANKDTSQGMRVLAFGNPLGLTDSVVAGIVSAKREVQGRQLLQLAMPIEPGNSGGPLVDIQGRVHGIINMKSAVNDNLGFAIPVADLIELKKNPNPVAIDRWARLGQINRERWEPLFGSTWQQRGGQISARGSGKGFGGRSLCLSKQPVPKLPWEIAVMVRLDDESGAAGLIFHSDGADRHYGFYPSSGNLRLSCFKGATVYSWQVLKEVESEHYLPGQWNHLKVSIDEDSIKCFCNGHLVIESTDKQLTEGQVGLAKFRGTRPDFKNFEIGTDLAAPTLSEAAEKWLSEIQIPSINIAAIRQDQIGVLGESGEVSEREIIRKAVLLEQQAKKLRRLAKDVRRANTISALRDAAKAVGQDQLLNCTMLIAQLDNPDIDIDLYKQQIDEMATEIREMIDEEADATDRRNALHRFMFDQNGFHGSRSEYYHPANSHLNRVIDDREGLPITMSILYMELGRRLDLKMQGVGLPGHFVVRHVIDEDKQQLVDVFERGKLLSSEDAENIVRLHAGRPISDDDLKANSSIEILSRVLNNLLGIAGRDKDAEALLRYSDALVALNPDVPQYRLMRAELRGYTDRKALAIDDLDWLIEKDPPGFDYHRAQQVRDALQSQ